MACVEACDLLNSTNSHGIKDNLRLLHTTFMERTCIQDTFAIELKAATRPSVVHPDLFVKLVPEITLTVA